VPEEVIVLETVESVERFVRAVEKIPGMEWLVEIEDVNIPPDDDFFALNDSKERHAAKALRGRLFMIFTNQVALRQLLSLWKLWQAGQKMPYGLGAWQTLFSQLRDVRLWGVEDRLTETGVLADWQERVDHEQEMIPCEIELWFRQGPQQRKIARDRVARLIEAQDGRLVHEAMVEGISYHAMLAYLPIGCIRSFLDIAAHDAELVQCEQIQFFRASGQTVAILADDERQYNNEGPDGSGAAAGRPIVALFDGLPLQAHHHLEGHLIVDDPDNFEADYPVNERRHGTSMASLILHGDLSAREAILTQPLYVRPILRPDLRGWRSGQETVPEGTLVVDLLHRAVRRLFEGEGDEPPVAPSVSIINFSIGIRDRLFDGSLSPLARLLDWLAWKYQVLFVVSAGNHSHRIELGVARGALSTLAPADLQNLLVRALASDARHRSLLSPAEGINVLTVGALQEDASTGVPPPYWIHPYADNGLPSPINAQGMGYRRAIKPEILAPGGRVLVQEQLSSTTQAALDIYDRALPPGQAVAAPGPTAGDRSATWFTRGTSNATALVSRGAAQLYNVLDELHEDSGSEIIDTVPRAVWLKALLTHSAEWRDAGAIFENILKTPDNSRSFKEYITRLLGYGAVDIMRVRECTAFRVTALGGGLIAKDQSHIHRFPLPPSLSGKRGYRKLVITLAWFTPVNPRHISWRRADLWFAPPEGTLNIDRQQADWRAVQRGTLQHEVLQGDQAAVFVDGANLEIQVSCRADAGTLEEQVPYAVVTTLEVAEEVGVEIYEEIRVRVQDRVRVAPSS
jgi:hypothetical protein